MKILLLGATGRTGKLVLEAAITEGFQVNCLVRKPEKVSKHAQVSIFEGNPNNPDDLEKAIEGCEVIISVLNISRKSDFPWAKLRTPPTYLSDVMHKLIPIAEAKGVRRIVACSAWGVGETKADIPGWFRWFIDNSNIGAAYRDHERQEELLKNSNLDWTIVRPTGLTNSKKRQVIQETFGKTPKPGLMISRQSVADYMVKAVSNEDLIQKAIAISKGP